ncbi:MAG: 1,2-phenylacetyl-CoA epoxidase subunit PaaD [Burkholderiaceae bacterium]
MNESREQPALDEIRGWLAAIPDPEIPVISLTDLGIIRELAWEDETLVVTVTPTYSGCPATALINDEIRRTLQAHGLEQVELRRRLSPPWTTDWISNEARERLRAYGIAPPVDGTAAPIRLVGRISRLASAPPTVPCPRCGSTHTERVSQHGSTPCKANWRCADCLEPFDYFKCI